MTNQKDPALPGNEPSPGPSGETSADGRNCRAAQCGDVPGSGPSRSQAISGTNFLEGKILIAMPGMPDPRFEKSVIFMCAHSEDGAMGIIINRTVEGLSLRELLQKLELETSPNMPDLPVFFGGPVETGRGFVLHSPDYRGDDSTLAVTEDVSLTATLDTLSAIGKACGPRQSLFALGYAGWGPGQIETEIRANGWIHCDSDPQLVFEAALEKKWTLALRKLGIDISSLASQSGQA
jgi:putative transcriptional regulator